LQQRQQQQQHLVRRVACLYQHMTLGTKRHLGTVWRSAVLVSSARCMRWLAPLGNARIQQVCSCIGGCLLVCSARTAIGAVHSVALRCIVCVCVMCQVLAVNALYSSCCVHHTAAPIACHHHVCRYSMNRLGNSVQHVAARHCCPLLC
jgi:hypothetical protein